MFSTAVLIQESKFINGILTNSDVWTTMESLYLENGILDIETIIISRRKSTFTIWYKCFSTKTNKIDQKF